MDESNNITYMIGILEKYNVSHETYENLNVFAKLVLDWNQKFNLISKSTESIIWERHILDSLQTCKFISVESENLIDLGSGAGFPGIVVGIIAKQIFPELKVNLIESIGKKASFLLTVKNELALDNVTIYNNRIEDIKIEKADIITSRALAVLTKLLEYSKPFCKKNTKLIFPKGEKWKEEIKIAQKKWYFKYKAFPSETNIDGRILSVRELEEKKNG